MSSSTRREGRHVGPASREHFVGHGNIVSWQSPSTKSDDDGSSSPAVRAAEPPRLAAVSANGTAAPHSDAESGSSGVAPRPSSTAAQEEEALDAVRAQRSLFLRALTSRLAEIKGLAASWASWEGGSERAYLATLRSLRDTCHEWAAVDVVRALNACNGSLVVDGGAVGEVERVPLKGGLPTWSYPAYPRLPWARYACPVWESLLYSVYEDYAVVALEGLRRACDALEPAFVLGATCGVTDLEEPESGRDEGEGGESKEADASSASAHAERAMRHAAAVSCVEAVHRTFPLLAALGNAAGNPGPAAKSAAVRGRKLADLHHSVAHLTAAAAALSILC
jgi:hypothetical protein